MGSLGVAGETADTGRESPAPEPQEDAPAAAEDEDEPAEGALSRRAQAEAEREARVAALEKNWGEKFTQAEQRAQQIAQQNEYLRGQLEALQRGQQQAQQPTTPKEDPDELDRQAAEAVGAGKFGDYQRLTNRASMIRAEQLVESRLQSYQQQQQQAMRQQPAPMDPFIAGQLSIHEHVRNEGPRGERIVTRMAEDLRDAGWQPGPALVAEAFRLANEQLGAKKKAAPAPQTFDRAAAGALGGVPAGRATAPAGGGGSAGGADDMKLTKDQEEVLANSGMTRKQYISYLKDPKAAAAAERKARNKRK